MKIMRQLLKAHPRWLTSHLVRGARLGQWVTLIKLVRLEMTSGNFAQEVVLGRNCQESASKPNSNCLIRGASIKSFPTSRASTRRPLGMCTMFLSTARKSIQTCYRLSLNGTPIQHICRVRWRSKRLFVQPLWIGSFKSIITLSFCQKLCFWQLML